MKRYNTIGIFALAVLLTASLDVWAQPGGGGGRGSGQRGGRGGAAAQIMRFLPVDQVLSYLAFDDKIALSNDQLIKVRDVLKGIQGKRTELMRSMRGNNDQQAAMQEVRKLRTEMLTGLQAVINDDQHKALTEYMQRMGQRGRGGPGGRGSGRRGGGGGGRGGDGA